MENKKVEVVNDLLGFPGMKIIQRPDIFNFSLDSTLLASFVTINQKDKLQNLEKELNSLVFGQEVPISEVVKSVKRARAGFGKKEKPESVFLFVGSSGVGKTELAKSLATSLDLPLLRFDMSEYQEKHSVSRFIGSPPGYVGYEEGGLLTKSLKKNPYSVVLFDEIEKAHQDI